MPIRASHFDQSLFGARALCVKEGRALLFIDAVLAQQHDLQRQAKNDGYRANGEAI